MRSREARRAHVARRPRPAGSPLAARGQARAPSPRRWETTRRRREREPRSTTCRRGPRDRGRWRLAGQGRPRARGPPAVHAGPPVWDTAGRGSPRPLAALGPGGTGLGPSAATPVSRALTPRRPERVPPRLRVRPRPRSRCGGRRRAPAPGGARGRSLCVRAAGTASSSSLTHVWAADGEKPRTRCEPGGARARPASRALTGRPLPLN